MRFILTGLNHDTLLIGTFFFFFFNWDIVDLKCYISFRCTTEGFTFFFFFLAVLGLRFCARAFSSCGKRGATLHCGALASHYRGLSLWSTGSRRAGSATVAHGPATPRHVGSSQTRAWTHVPRTSRQILNHCTTREAPHIFKGYTPFIVIIKSAIFPVMYNISL